MLHLPSRKRTRPALHLVAALLFSIMVTTAVAEDVPEFRLTFRDGEIIPLETRVPTNRRLKLILVNEGDSPVEFESTELRREKVIAPKVTTSIVIRRLDAGEHVFFDDFHPDAPQARIIAEDAQR
jgi:hypothetical protein